MNRHDKIREMLARRSELTPNEELDIQEHLSVCPACRETADEYARQAALLRSIPAAIPPTMLRARVLESIHAHPGKRQWRPPLKSLLPPAAVVAMAAIVALAYVNRPQEGRQPGALVHPSALPHATTVVPTSTPTATLRVTLPTSHPGTKGVPRHRSRGSVTRRSVQPSPVIQPPAVAQVVATPRLVRATSAQQPRVSSQSPVPVYGASKVKPNVSRRANGSPTSVPVSVKATAPPAAAVPTPTSQAVAASVIRPTPTPAPHPPPLPTPPAPPTPRATVSIMSPAHATAVPTPTIPS